DVQIQLHKFYVGAYPITQALKQGRIGLGPKEWLARRVDRRYAATRNDYSSRTAGGARLFRDFLAESIVLLRRRPHERHVWVMLVEAPVPKLERHSVRRPEIDHVQGAERDHLRHSAQRGRRQPIGTGAQLAADQLVSKFRRGDVQY